MTKKITTNLGVEINMKNSNLVEANLEVRTVEDCERFLFGDPNKLDNEGLSNIEIDDIMYNDFKQKFENEVEEFTEDDVNFESEIDDSVTSKLEDISLEDAVMDFRDGINDAFDYVYAHYRPVLNRYGKRYNNEELAIELLDIVLLNAVKTFDINAKTKFNTYFWTCIHNYVNCYRIKNNAQKRAHNKDMKSLQEKCMYKGDKADAELESTIEDKSLNKNNDELRMSITSLNDCLKANEITILLKLIDNYTLQEIGDCLGITAAAVCMSLKRISKKKNAAKKIQEILRSK